MAECLSIAGVVIWYLSTARAVLLYMVRVGSLWRLGEIRSGADQVTIKLEKAAVLWEENCKIKTPGPPSCGFKEWTCPL